LSFQDHEVHPTSRYTKRKILKPATLLKRQRRIYKRVFVEIHFLRLVRPDVVGDLTDQLELVDHAVPINGVTLTVRRKATLRADTNLVERRIQRDVVTLSNDLGSVDNALLHLLLILHGGKLAGDDTQDDVLVGGEVLERLEATGTLGVVLEVVGVHVQLLEELDGDAVVAALGEVAAANEVAAAQVHSDVHVGGQVDEAVVVQLDVLLEHGVCAVHVCGVFLEAVQELLRAEVCY